MFNSRQLSTEVVSIENYEIQISRGPFKVMQLDAK